MQRDTQLYGAIIANPYQGKFYSRAEWSSQCSDWRLRSKIVGNEAGEVVLSSSWPTKHDYILFLITISYTCNEILFLPSLFDNTRSAFAVGLTGNVVEFVQYACELSSQKNGIWNTGGL